LIGIIIYTLFVFWVCGIVSVFIDIDHIFVLIGRKSPIKLSESYGRPFHSRIVFALVAVAISFFMASFGYGFYRGILFGLDPRGSLLLMIGIVVGTFVGTKKIGNIFSKRLKNQRRLWKEEKLK